MTVTDRDVSRDEQAGWDQLHREQLEQRLTEVVYGPRCEDCGEWMWVSNPEADTDERPCQCPRPESELF